MCFTVLVKSIVNNCDPLQQSQEQVLFLTIQVTFINRYRLWVFIFHQNHVSTYLISGDMISYCSKPFKSLTVVQCEKMTFKVYNLHWDQGGKIQKMHDFIHKTFRNLKILLSNESMIVNDYKNTNTSKLTIGPFSSPWNLNGLYLKTAPWELFRVL